MERSREAKRGASAPRRLRISCPMIPADAEARMDETPLIEKVKKGNLQAFPVSLSATATAWSKRKRNGMQEAQVLLERINVVKGSAEGLEMAPSTKITKDFAEELEMALPKEDEDEIPLLSNFRPHGKSTIKERAREDELVMDISNIPRKARSSSSRFSSLRRQQEPCSAGASPQQAPRASQQRSPSPKLLAKRPVGTKSRLLKDFRVMGSTQISDQEVEVAEVLFDLSRSMPSFAQSTSLICQAKSCRRLDEEDFDSSSSQAAGNSASESLQKPASCPSNERKSKRQRASLKVETILKTSLETVAAGGGCFVGPFSVIHSSVMEDNQMDQAQNKHGVTSEFFCHQPELMSSEVVTNPCHGDSQSRPIDDKNANYFEPRSKELARAKAMKNNLDNSPETLFAQDGLAPPSPSIRKSKLWGQDAEQSKLLSRSREDQDANGTSSKLDPMCLQVEVSTEEQGEDNMQADNKRLPLSESSSNFARDYGGKTLFATTEHVSRGHSVKGASAADVEDESTSDTRLANERNQELPKHTSSPWKEEQNRLRLLDVKQEKDTAILDLRKDVAAGSAVSSSPLTIHVSSNNSVTWMGRFPPPGFSAKAAPPCPTNSSHLGTVHDRPTSYPALQLPHSRAQHAVPRMRRCATHVHVAHYIQQQQRSLRQAYRPPPCRSGTPYNLSTLPADLQGKEQWNGSKDANIPSLQAGRAHGHTPSESVVTRMPNSRGSVTTLKSENTIAGSCNSARVLSVGAGTCVNGMTLAPHALYSQKKMQQNGFASLCVPSNGSPGQGASIFNKSFDPAHLSPQDLQSHAQQTSSLLRLHKHQEGPHSSPHVGLSHPLSTEPHQQLQQRAQQEQVQQQRRYVTTLSQHYRAGSNGFAEGNQGCTILRKQSSASPQQTQFQVQHAASPSSSVHSPQLSSHNSGPLARSKVRELDPSVTKGIDLLGMSSKGPGSVGPFQLELATFAVAAKVRSGFPGACEIDRGHDQRQQNLGAQKQQYYQRYLARAPAPLSHHNKDHGFLEEKQSPAKQAESPAAKQQSISSQLGTTHQVYQQPYPLGDNVRESPSPQKSQPLHAQQLSSQHIQPQIQSSAHQQSHLLHSCSSNATVSGGLSSVTLRTALQGNTNNSLSPGGASSEK